MASHLESRYRMYKSRCPDNYTPRLCVGLSVCLLPLSWPNWQTYGLELWHWSQVEEYLGQVYRSRSLVNGQGHEIKNCSFVMFHWLLGTLSWWTCQRRNSGIRRGVFSKRMHFFITYNQSIIKATSRSGGKGMEHPGCILFYKLHTYRPSLSSHNIFLPITWDIKFHFDNIMTMTNFRHNSSIVAPMLLGCERSD